MPELSTNTYTLPFAIETPIDMVVYDSPAHTGPFEGAVDIAIPLYTDILAPLDGVVREAIDVHNQYGDSSKFADYVNYVQILHKNGETSELLHLDKGSVSVRPGEKIQVGQRLGRTGLSGWMTAPHVHWFVHKQTALWPRFVGLAIRLDEVSGEVLRKAGSQHKSLQ